MLRGYRPTFQARVSLGTRLDRRLNLPNRWIVTTLADPNLTALRARRRASSPRRIPIRFRNDRGGDHRIPAVWLLASLTPTCCGTSAFERVRPDQRVRTSFIKLGDSPFGAHYAPRRTRSSRFGSKLYIAGSPTARPRHNKAPFLGDIRSSAPCSIEQFPPPGNRAVIIVTPYLWSGRISWRRHRRLPCT